jgi:hypothetical protein
MPPPSSAEPIRVASGSPGFALGAALRFVRSNALAMTLVSILLVAPCFWHTHIQAGDLGSHVYNAWLAQLAQRHQVSGIVVVNQRSNVLFDLLMLHAANVFGFVAAERIVVSLGVLIFFWGAFSFLAVVSGRAPWLVAPFLFVLAYGYAFHMGFMNYCFSVGLALFALAAGLSGRTGNWLVAVLVAALALVAHPLGFVLFLSLAVYISVWQRVPRWPRLTLPLLAVGSFVLLRAYFHAHQNLLPSWRAEGFLQLLGQDQMNVYGRRYLLLSWAGLAWGVVSAIGAAYDWIFRGRAPSRALWIATEFYVVAVAATVCLPENFRTGLYAGWVGLLVSRLTLVTAVFGLLVLTSLRLPRWSWRGAAVIAAIYSGFLWQDTGKLDRLEANARSLTQSLAPGTRIVAVANAPEGWRVPFIYHSIDRACIGHCFSFANYEASSLQFRVRARPGNSVVTTSVDQSDDMSSGDYRVRKRDLPLVSIYQCDDTDFTKLCALPLREGQKTEDPESEPVLNPAPDPDSGDEN